MFTSFSTALSGLNAMTNAIDVTGNNLSNLNTTGYKDQSVSFQELLSESLGGSASSQVGLGVSRPVTTAQFTQGATQTTGNNYDAAIQGNGFFVVKNADKQTLFTRDGGFQVDANGYLTTTGGQRVQGWMTGNGSSVNTNGALTDIQVPVGETLQPKETTQLALGANLDATATATFSTSVTGGASGSITVGGSNNALNLVADGSTYHLTLANTDTTMAAAASDISSQLTAAGSSATAGVDGNGNLLIKSGASGPSAYVQILSGNANGTLGLSTTPTTNTGVNSNLSAVINAVDSLGNTVPVTLSFTKMTQGGQWNYTAAVPSSSVNAGSPTTIASGSVEFSNTGQLIAPSAINGNIALNVSGLSDGAAPMNVNWNLYKSDGTPMLTQFSEASGTSSNTQDGQTAAQLTGFSLGDNGQVLATYSGGSGTQQVVGQLALANVTNPQSLIGVADNNFSLGAGSAAPVIGAAGTGGRGSIQGGAIESSTVNIATEFSNLLTFERSYQADSRVVTVSDEMTQDAVGLVK